MNYHGRAAGRSGVGAVMGSKKLKAIVANGKNGVTINDRPKALELRKNYLAALKDIHSMGYLALGVQLALTQYPLTVAILQSRTGVVLELWISQRQTS